jgi:hypothetical protein
LISAGEAILRFWAKAKLIQISIKRIDDKAFIMFFWLNYIYNRNPVSFSGVWTPNIDKILFRKGIMKKRPHFQRSL